MKILAIETSCDDTGIAVLEADKHGNFDILANVVASQIKIHKKYGGVFPAMAKREHQKNLLPTLIKALNLKSQTSKLNQITKSKLKILHKILKREPDLAKKLIPYLEKCKKPDTDFISVTNGPGLEPCLWVGVNFARALSYFWDIPLVPVNHIESHILVNFLNNPEIKFPAIALVVSGGHTQIILVKSKPRSAKASRGTYKILGETRDDAAGECFDKCAKILGLGYPGGPEIAKLASKIVRSPTPHNLPRPMINTQDYDFSFSGLKTAVLYQIQRDYGVAPLRQGFAGRQYIDQMCVEIQQAIVDVLIKKTIKAVKNFKAKTLILGGGVSANTELKKQFKEKIAQEELKIDFIFPQVDHSTDNGLMAAVAGYFHRTKKIAWQKLSADANLRISK